MKNFFIAVMLSFLIFSSFPVFGAEQGASEIPKTIVDVRYANCPGMGGAPVEEVAAMHEGKVYHFCCAGCIPGFKKDPKGTIGKIKDAKEVPLKIVNAEGKCPSEGGVIKPDLFQVKGDTITFFCCPDCMKGEKKESAKTEDKEKHDHSGHEGHGDNHGHESHDSHEGHHGH